MENRMPTLTIEEQKAAAHPWTVEDDSDGCRVMGPDGGLEPHQPVFESYIAALDAALECKDDSLTDNYIPPNDWMVIARQNSRNDENRIKDAEDVYLQGLAERVAKQHPTTGIGSAAVCSPLRPF